MFERQVLNPPSVPDTLRYGFSQAVVFRGGRRIVLSGQVGVDADERTVGPDLARQLEAAIRNIAAVLAAARGTLAHVIVLRIYLVDSARGDQRHVGEALRRHFPVDPPATSWVLVSGLSDPAWLVELEAEAVLPD